MSKKVRNDDRHAASDSETFPFRPSLLPAPLAEQAGGTCPISTPPVRDDPLDWCGHQGEGGLPKAVDKTD